MGSIASWVGPAVMVIDLPSRPVAPRPIRLHFVMLQARSCGPTRRRHRLDRLILAVDHNHARSGWPYCLECWPAPTSAGSSQGQMHRCWGREHQGREQIIAPTAGQSCQQSAVAGAIRISSAQRASSMWPIPASVGSSKLSRTGTR